MLLFRGIARHLGNSEVCDTWYLKKHRLLEHDSRSSAMSSLPFQAEALKAMADKRARGNAADSVVITAEDVHDAVSAFKKAKTER